MKYARALCSSVDSIKAQANNCFHCQKSIKLVERGVWTAPRRKRATRRPVDFYGGVLSALRALINEVQLSFSAGCCIVVSAFEEVEEITIRLWPDLLWYSHEAILAAGL